MSRPTDEEFIAARRAYQKAWREKNRDHVRAYAEKWRRDNSDRVKATAQAWRQRNPEKSSAYSRRWRERHPERARQAAYKTYMNNLEHIAAESGDQGVGTSDE